MANSASAERIRLLGGAGAQILSGGPGDDLLYGDRAPGAEGELERRDSVRADGDPALAGPARAVGLVQGDAPRFFSAAADLSGGGVGGWTLEAGDRLGASFSQGGAVFGPGDLMTGAPALAALSWAGTDYLVTGGHGVSLARLGADGAPELLATAALDWTSGLLRPGAFAPYVQDGALHVLVGGGWDGGLTVLRHGAGGLQTVARLEDDAAVALAQVADIALAGIGGRRFAAVVSHGDGGLSIYELGAGAPVLRDRRGFGDGESGFDLARLRAVEVAAIGANTYVFAGAEGGRLVTYRLDADGLLTRIAAQQGAWDLVHLRLDGRDWLATVDGGAAVRIYAIAANGRLDLHETLSLGAGAQAVSLGAAIEGGRALLLAARADNDGHDLLSFGPDGDDVLRGGAGRDELRGGGGADRLFGGIGPDRLSGDAGDDWLEGGAGDDFLWGGAGDDVLRGGGGADLLKGQTGDDRLLGHGGADRLYGASGADALSGGAGDDLLRGGGGDDALWGGGGADRLLGDAGRDRLNGGAGDDVLYGGGAVDSLSGGLGRDRLWGGSGADRLGGGGGGDRLSGGDGNDRLWGGAGADALFGDAGADQLFGGPGADRLFGGAGADRLFGGGGRDRLEGGGGRDVFVFAPGEGRAVIGDFAPGVDRLLFEGADHFGDLRLWGRGGDAVIAGDGVRVILDGVAPQALDAGDFLFG